MKGINVVIRDDIKKEGCKGTNNGWDDEKKRCYDLMIWNQKPQSDSKRYFGGANDLNGLFQKYGMDAASTMRNSAECWKANGGSSHTPQPWVQINQKVQKLPKCFFAAAVHKDTYDSKRKGIKLDPTYVGSRNDRKANEDMLWPR